MRTLLRQKLVDSWEQPLPKLTRRDTWIPRIPGKTVAVIGMRRSGKTSLLWQEVSRRVRDGAERSWLPMLSLEAERFFILQQIDTLWREHLQSMDALRESVGLRGYGQMDPLIDYKNESYDMFLEMMTKMRRYVIHSMFMFQPVPAPQGAAT